MFFFNDMKKSLLYIFCLVLMAGACMQDQTNPLVIGTCYDGKKNQDETGIDCGGRCQSCLQSPCTKNLSDNELIYNGSTVRLTSSDYQSAQKANAYVFDAIVSWGGELHISLGGSTVPKEEKIYPIVKTLKEGSATVTMEDDNMLYTASSGNVYMTIRKGKVVVELCSVTVSASPYMATFTGRIISQ